MAYQEGMEILDGLRLRHPLVPEYSMEWCSTRYSLSVTEYLAGNHGRTLELLKENAHTYTALADTYPDQRVDYLNRAAVGWNMISTVDKELGDLDGARHAIELALEIYQRVESERPDWIFNQVLIAESEVNLGGLLVDDGQMDFAKERFQSAIRRAERTVKEQPDHERGRRVLYGARNALAEQYYKLNQLEAAFSENAAALDVFQDALAWQAHLRQAQLAAKNGDYPASEVILRNFIEEIAARQEHFLEAARSAVATAQAVPPNQQTQIDRFRGIGREALSRAEELSAEKASVFRAKLIQDALLQTLISD